MTELSPAEKVNSDVVNPLLEALHHILHTSQVNHAQAIATSAALLCDAISLSIGPREIKDLILLEILDFIQVRMAATLLYLEQNQQAEGLHNPGAHS